MYVNAAKSGGVYPGPRWPRFPSRVDFSWGEPVPIQVLPWPFRNPQSAAPQPGCFAAERTSGSVHSLASGRAAAVFAGYGSALDQHCVDLSVVRCQELDLLLQLLGAFRRGRHHPRHEAQISVRFAGPDKGS